MNGKANSIWRILRIFIILALVWTALTALILWLNRVAVPAKAANSSAEELWQDVPEDSIDRRGPREIVPERYRTVRLNKAALNEILRKTPMEYSGEAALSDVVLTLPMPDGAFERFRIVESPIMHPDLADKAPELKTYRGQGIDDPTAMMRFDFTPTGFHALILRAGSSVFIDPYSKGDTDNYISYFKNDFRNDAKRMRCLFSSDKVKPHHNSMFSPYQPDISNGATRKIYRLALAANYEYSVYHTPGMPPLPPNKDGPRAAIVTTMNRVNGVYERDFSARMVLVPNNDDIIFITPADPYNNENGVAMLAQNQATVDAVIGTANYDIGHVFSTGGGGVAFLNSLCNNFQKAGGVTGSTNPVGDPFDIDYVAHEMGHQWGGNHTFNGSTSACGGGNRNATAAFEPGSGITIQAYAGICGAQDLQNNSIDVFNIRSLEEMLNHINGAGNCSTMQSPTGNNFPTVNAGPDRTIPRQTPFTLTAAASDPNGDAITYNWEQYNLAAQSPPDTDDDGQPRPIFRTYPSTTNPSRTFPSLPYILNNANMPPTNYTGTAPTGAFCSAGTCLTGEILPSITRTMTFQVTVRDNRSGNGAINTDLVQVNVTAASGPFVVTQPNTNVSWGGGTIQTVTWNVANTTAAPVGAANVNILLSTDGGMTFPTTLASNTPNDGTESVTTPNTPSTTARIRVEGAGNIFFDISDTNFTISPPTAAAADLNGRIVDQAGRGIARARLQIVSSDGSINLTAISNAFGYFRFAEIPTGVTYIITPTHKRYAFEPPSLFHAHFEETAGLIFIGIM